MGKSVQNKKIYIEILRILAAFLVIVNHTNSRIFQAVNPSALWYGSIAYFFASKIAVPLFVMVSGALLLTKQDSLEKYCSRVLRIAIVTVVFSVVTFVYHDWPLNVMTYIKNILSGYIAEYWYLYLYIGLLLMLPVFQKIAAAFEKREILFIVVLTLGLGGVLPMLEFVGFRVSSDLLLGVFSPYVGMVFAGYYIERYADINGTKAALSAVGFVILTLLQTAVTAKSYHTRNGVDYLWLDNVKFITITLSAVCVYIMVKYICTKITFSAKICRAICFVGSLTFGVYLLGDIARDMLEGVYAALSNNLPVMPAMVIFQLCIFAAAAVVTAVLKLIPGVKRLL